MRAFSLALAVFTGVACAAPLRAGEVRAGEVRAGASEAGAAARLGPAAIGSLPALAAPLAPRDGNLGPGAAAGPLESGVSLAAPAAAAAPAAPGAAAAPAAAAGAASPGAATARASTRIYGAADLGAGRSFSPGRTLGPSFAGAGPPAAAAPSQDAWERKASLLARRGAGIAAALGFMPAPQDSPVEKGSPGGIHLDPAARSGWLATHQHVPEHVDEPQPRPAPGSAAPAAPKPGRPIKALFGPALAAALVLLPSLVHANPFSPMGPGPRFTVTLPLLLLAAVIALARLPLSELLARTNPHSLGEGDGGTDGVARLPLWALPAVVFFYAAIEEVTYRAVGFMGAVLLLFHFLPPHAGLAGQAAAAGVYAAAALASSWVFAISHRYAELWPRFIGGLVYCAALVMTGSLLFPTLIHAFYNLTLFLQRRRQLRAGKP